MKIGIAIDRWKLAIFSKHLSAAGYEYKGTNGVTPDTLMLYVTTKSAAELEPVVRAANTEAAKEGAPATWTKPH